MTRFPELSGIVEMDSKRLIIFIVLSMGILLLWQEYFAPKPAPQQVAQTQTASQPDAPASHTASAQPADAAKLSAGQRIRERSARYLRILEIPVITSAIKS